MKMRKLAILFCLWTKVAAAAPDLTATSDHILDGDTFSAVVGLENGAKISVRVRFMNMDAPEMNGECESEIERAERSKDRLAELLPKGTKVILSKIKDDKYLGRIDAYVKFPDGRDIGEIMIRENLARAYGGGRREPWCAADEIERWNKRSKK